MAVGQIMGGLGNQLFIIFTTIAYALENNMDYSIINIEKRRKSYFDTELYKHVKVNDKKLRGFKTYKEPNYHFNEIPKEDTLILNGYFQSYKYFDKYKDLIISMLEFKNDVKLNNYDGFLHFRLGDYKNIECHPVCDIEYYIKSLKDIEEKEPVFSSKKLKFIYYFEEADKKEVEEKVDILRNKFKTFTFEPVDKNLKDYQQMLSMTSLKYCIISNSTFSWWGSYLNKRDDKIVYYPEKWFEGSLSNNSIEDLIPKNWKK